MNWAQKNLKVIHWIKYDNNICQIKANLQESKIEKTLFFNLQKQTFEEYISTNQLGQIIDQTSFSLFLGVLSIYQNNFFVFAKQVTKVGQIKNHNVYKIVNIKIIPFADKGYSDFDNIKIKSIYEHFQDGFYFSYTIDLSQFNKTFFFGQNIFMANYPLLEFLSNYDTCKKWIVPVIQGCFQQIGENIKFLFRQKQQEQGFSTLDMFVEQKQKILNYKFYFWDYQGQLENRLFDQIQKSKQKFLFIYGREKNIQKKNLSILEEYFAQINKQNTNVKYQFTNEEVKFIDFQNKEKDKFYKFEEISQYFYYKDMSQKEQEQQGFFVFAFSNFLNHFLFQLLVYIIDLKIQQITQDINIDLKQILECMTIICNDYQQMLDYYHFDYINYYQEKFKIIKREFEQKNYRNFKTIINQSNFQTQKKSTKSMLQTIMVTESFAKEFKINSKHSILSKCSSRNFSLGSNKILDKQTSYKILLFNYKISNQTPEFFHKEFKDQFLQLQMHQPQIVIITLQDIEKYSKFKALLNNSKNLIDWMTLLDDIMNTLQKIYQSYFQNMCTIIYTLPQFAKQIEVIDVDKTSLGSFKLKQKGSLTQVLKINKTLLQIINCDLTGGSGEKQKRNRLFDIDQIINNTTSRFNYLPIERIVWAGNFNFRLNIEKQKMIQMIETQQTRTYHQIKNQDEITQVKQQIKQFSLFKEMPIWFVPTYKYEINQKSFSSQETCPSYCDRIFFKSEIYKLTPLEYGSIDIYFSDHKPVYLLFTLNEDN